jgi:hypothetical protein
MPSDLSEGLLDRLKAMFPDCDEARITSPRDTHFLILGWWRNTKDAGGQWFRGGEPTDLDYLEEAAVASGATEAELVVSAERYKALIDGGWREFFRQESIEVTPELEAIIAAKENVDRVRLSEGEGDA